MTAPSVSLFEMTADLLGNTVPVLQCSKMTLVHISHTLEDIVLKNRLPAMMFTGFQESSHWHKETARYRELALMAQQICVFAGKPLPDEQPSDVIQIELADGDALRQEWFVIILSDRFNVLLTGQDRLTSEGVLNDSWRTFRTILSFDPDVIDRVLDALDGVIDHYRPDLLENLRANRNKFALLRSESSYLSSVVTEMVHFEEMLNQTLRRERTLKQRMIDTMQSVTLTTTPDGKITSVNNALSLMLKKQTSEIVGADFFDTCLTVDAHAQARLAFEQVMSTQSIYRFTTPLQRSERIDGTTRVIEWELSLMYMPDDEQMIFIVGTDITERLMVEQLRRDEAVLRVALEKERELRRVRDVFITTVSHEFRTPLTGILNAAEMLERHYEKLGEDGRERRLGQIKKQVKVLTAMIEDISIIASANMGGLKLAPSEQNIVQATRDILRASRLKNDTYTHEMALIVDDLPAKSYRVDVRLLSLILSNLVENAFKYTPATTPISVALRQEDDTLVYTVTDEGTGIPEIDRPHIFEPFYRGKNISNTNGTGMGLHIVRDCVAIYGGKLSYTTGIDGTAFMVTLPLLNAMNDMEEARG